MTVLEQLNSPGMYLICGAIVAFIAVVCVIFMVRAWKAGKALGMDTVRMKRAITSSVTFSILPSVGILLGVLALSGSLGLPWPWLRLSVIGALHYETQVADAAAEQLGIRLGSDAMTVQAFSTIALLMSVCIMWGMILQPPLSLPPAGPRAWKAETGRLRGSCHGCHVHRHGFRLYRQLCGRIRFR